MADNEYPPPPNAPPPYNPAPGGWPAPPPPAWPPPPGGYAPYSYPPPAPPVAATAILVFGILGIVLALSCGIGGIFGIVAWVMGNGALDTLNRVGDPLGQRGTVTAGRICGIVGTGLMALVVLVFAAAMVFAILSPDKGS